MHHNLDDGELIMVDKDVHNVYRHTGGDGLQRHGFYDTVAGGIVGFLAPNAQNAYSSKKGALDLTMNVLRDVVENVPLVGDAATGLLMGADEVSARKRAASTPQHVIIEDEIDRTQDWLDHHCSAWPGTPGCD